MSFYNFARGLFRTQFRIMGWTVKGVENLPKEGPVILACNHVSLWDPILMGCSLPRQVSYMAKDELFKVPLLGQAIRGLGAFPVKRGQSDTSAIKQSLAVLKEGRVLGLFPEGTRSKSGEIQKAMPGMVLLMQKSQAPVVPVKVYGTQHLITKGWGKFGVIVGKPLTPDMLTPPDGVTNKREWAADKIMTAIRELKD